jgi:hypothetical protein
VISPADSSIKLTSNGAVPIVGIAKNPATSLLRKRNTIHNNVIYGCDDSGIYCLLTTDSLKIMNNTIEGNGFGINIQHGSSGSVVGNNIIVNNNVGIYVYNQVSDILFNNVWNNATNYSPNVAGTGDISLDPQFVNLGAHDYHLTSGSPGINAGTDMGLPYNGAAPDIGAFEY